MSKFLVIPNGGGAARYSGCPTFTGTYMKPGMVEFREIASPTPIDWTVGDYIGYQSGSSVVPVYSRTGLRYTLYSVPQVKKQARSTEYGGAFIYKNVQFFDDSKQLEICPFRDLVAGDNRIHFSTQPSISTFEGVDGIARRIQACLDDMYPNTWVVRLATAEMGASQDLVDLMAEARDFTVSGVSLLGALDKVYEVWPEVGWTFSYEQVTIDGSLVWRNVLTIGGGGLSSTSSFLYGKGHGLKSITRTAANAEELANRLFVYGSSRNMLPRWYNSQNIKDAQSVDIQNLMIPVSEWGLTNVDGINLPDASKAYVEDAASIARLGLRPKTYYFDGTSDLPEIYPTLREATIKAVRDALGSSSAKYYPSTTVYTDENERVDRILSVQSTFDSGLSGADGKSAIITDYGDVSASGSGSATAGGFPTVNLFSKDIEATEVGMMNISASFSLSGVVSATVAAVTLQLVVYINGIGVSLQHVPLSESQVPGQWNIPSGSIFASNVAVRSGDTLTIEANVVLNNTAGAVPVAYTYSALGTCTFKMSLFRTKTFRITLRQLGFDVDEQANLGEGKTIAMRSGKCAGRTFTIKSVLYDDTNDAWELECYRSEDDSLSQWFPNTDYPVRGLENAGQENEYPGDEFVLLDIAMPDIYVRMAEDRLYQAAQDLLLDTAVERWQYTPDIDAKFMVENERVIVAGQNMSLQDADIIGPYPVNILVDSLTINEGEAVIPTYKVTLRDRKRKTWTESESARDISSRSVANSTQETVAQASSVVGETFFMLDDNGNVTLKEPFQNLWVPGWLAAGGVGTGGGGGGGASWLNDLNDVAAPNPAAGDLLSWDAITGKWVNVARNEVGTPVSLTNGSGYSSLTVNSVTADFYTKSQVDSIVSSLDVNVLSDIKTLQDGILTFEWSNGDTINVDLNHEHSDYVPLTRTINGIDLSQNRSFYVGKTAIQGTSQSQALEGILSVKETSAASLFEWEPDAGGTGVGAWRFHGNLYADGWIAAGGIGTGGGGGGGVSSFYDLPEIGIAPGATIGTFQILTYNGTAWVNEDLRVSVSNTIADGTTGYTRVATITVNGVPYNINAPADGGGGGGGGTEVDPVFTNSAAYGITSSDITAWNGKVSGIMMNGISQPVTNGIVNLGTVITAIPDLSGSYVKLSGTQTITGAKTFTSNLSVNAEVVVNSISSIIQDTTNNSALFNYGGRLTQKFNAYGTEINLRAFNASEQANILSVQTDRVLVGSQLLPNYATGINLGGNYENQRWSTIYGLNADLTGNLKMASTSHIDIGPVRIEYDAVNKAIHIKKADANDTNEYGFYCDGFVAAGGVQASE